MMPVTPLSSSSDTSGSSIPRTRTSGATPIASAVCAMLAIVSIPKIECWVSMKMKSWPVALAIRAISGVRLMRTVMPSATSPARSRSFTGLVSLFAFDGDTFLSRQMATGMRRSGLAAHASGEIEQPRRIVREDALAHSGVGRPVEQQVVELDGADPFMEREVREIAPPDELVRHRGDQRLGEGLDVGEGRVLREPVDAGELDPAAFRSVVGERQELLEAWLRHAIAGRKQPHMGDREADRQLAQCRHQLGDEPAGQQQVEMPPEFPADVGGAHDLGPQRRRQTRLR